METHAEEIKTAFSELQPGEKLFVVGVEERHVSRCLIGAKNEEEAVMKVREGNGTHLKPTEYLETIEATNWSVQEVTETT